ncbi:nucleotide exchange factor GrpE [Candidatus Collierbacteria bacterium RIFOXYD1_FULL_40_9]|uniref:Protein GrpE n=1 Tax=Candidatus Collierbacteria bacterium RIFOXYD1_FULL_40_9 TaxID=1817731 RepID=A0A1F5FUL6_9BACT|nr:MAG: nucleotide exchange factor GrpE [Candidatus Collierbacteria bacterium RIFOXYD1_FULL_40_9]
MVKKTKTPKNNNEIELLNSKILELEQNHKRVLADYQNQERRHKELETQIVKFAQASLIEKILLSIDSLEMAQFHLKDKGLQMVIDQLFKTLESEGLKTIDTNNLVFDPNTMDCLELATGEKDLVIETVSKGYLLYDKVLRPAKVKVGNGTPKA